MYEKLEAQPFEEICTLLCTLLYKLILYLIPKLAFGLLYLYLIKTRRKLPSTVTRRK